MDDRKDDRHEFKATPLGECEVCGGGPSGNIHDPNPPVCPYCVSDPALISYRIVQFDDGLQMMVVFCGTPSCRRVWNGLPMGQARQVIERPGYKPPRFGRGGKVIS